MSNNIINFNSPKESKVVIMCTILEKIKNKRALELLQEYNIELKPPIDISTLLERIGISTIAKDFSEMEKRNEIPLGSIYGAAFSNGDNLAIFYKKSDSFHRKKFTVAHELAHCCLHCPDNVSTHVEYRLSPAFGLTEEDLKKEKIADIFAGQLLIPKDPLIKVYNEMLIPSLTSLAKIFDVSCSVMAARLDYLEMSYYKDSFSEITL